MQTRLNFVSAYSLAVVLLVASQVKALNYDNICALVPQGTAIENSDDCHSYYQCTSSGAQLQYCQNGYGFNKQTQQCSNVVADNCATAHPCDGQLNKFVPTSKSCNSYYYCSKSGPELGFCPIGLTFNPNTQQCGYASTYSCHIKKIVDDSGTVVATPINLCDYVPNGIYFGNAGNCSAWNYCDNNILKSGNCPNNLVFNVERKMCYYQSMTDCSQVTNDPNLMQGSLKCSKLGDLLPTSVCDAYFVCNGESYVIETCPDGEYFDTVSKTCEDRMMARNDCDRCQGTTKEFVNAYSKTNCSGYLYCLHGKKRASGFCENGLLFDEDEGGCVEKADEPLFGCCNPAAYDSSEQEPEDPPAKDTTNSKPAVPVASSGKPAVSDASSAKPAVPDASSAKPAAPDASSAKPAVSDASAAKPKTVSTK